MNVIVTNVFGPLNFGDYELFSELISVVESSGEHRIYAIARDPILCKDKFPKVTFFEQLGKSDKVSSRIFRLLSCFVFLISRRLAKAALPESQYAALAAMADADVAIGCPGGFLEDSSASFYAHLAQLYLASKLAKKTILSPMSIGPARSRVNRVLLKIAIKSASEIFVRERFSATLCDTLKLSCTMSNDLAFRRFLSEKDLDRKEIGQTLYLTVINWSFPNSEDPQKSLENYLEKLVSVTKKLVEQHCLSVRVLMQVASDLPAIERFMAGLSVAGVESELVGHGHSPVTIMEELSKARLVIASRFHSAIFSLNVGVPVMAISYLPKTTEMLQLYGCDELFVDIDSFSVLELYTQCDRFLNDEQEFYSIRRKMEEGLVEVGDPFVEQIRLELNNNSSTLS